MMSIQVSVEILSILTDIAGCLLAALLVVFLTTGKRPGEVDRRLLVGALLLLAALTCNITGRSFAYIDAGDGTTYVTGFAVKSIMLISFGLLFSSIAVLFRCYALLGPGRPSKSRRRMEDVYCIASVAAGALIFLITGRTLGFALILLAELIIGLVCGLRESKSGFSRAAFAISVIVLSILLIIYMIWPSVRLMALGMIVMYVILYVEYIKYTERLAEERERELERIRLNLLMGQIYPHFIFNSLQTIKGLCISDPARAGEAIDTFADYLRANLESLTAETLIPFADELEHTKAFLALEEMQGGKRFSTEYRLEVTDFMIPPLVLQPLVENAVRHGASPGAGEVRITIETHCENERVYIKAANSCGSQRPEVPYQRKRRSVGIENVRKRLEAQCDGKLELNLTDDSAEAVIEIPYIPIQMNN